MASHTHSDPHASASEPRDDVHTLPRVLADHVALDLVNTVGLVDGESVDYWQSDADVLAWLGRTGLIPEGAPAKTPPKGLLDAARALRDPLRQTVARRKAGKKLDLGWLNDALAAGGSHLATQIGPDGNVIMTRVYPVETAAHYLVPLAEAIADLLVHGDFDLVKQCESDDCILWFYDRTRSHRRRWCSMALCGNRHKVAAFRRREAADDTA
ncbi:CGNR zinc finger domain-containing protein [Cupriavidus plantarum]|uniref:CGNR zinc finger domain-containing protein n=1 Tax=Cupriavidus plantarum TaxID=942865 RepID=UPI000EB24185|nr:ABATE domain-containing protein [Cupriavidus plantarum]RLK33391.1 putative RNA-binding Zn ribbon-like protein [Cupriavidus plantarum]